MTCIAVLVSPVKSVTSTLFFELSVFAAATKFSTCCGCIEGCGCIAECGGIEGCGGIGGCGGIIVAVYLIEYIERNCIPTPIFSLSANSLASKLMTFRTMSLYGRSCSWRIIIGYLSSGNRPSTILVCRN